MILHIGERVQVENPTSDEVASHVRNLTPELPYLRLEADGAQYLQVALRKGAYWIEWRQERAHRCVVTSVNEAQALFEAYLRRDEPALAAAPWRRLTLFNDPYRRLLLVLTLSVLFFVLIAVYRVAFPRR
jgi:hypothetical protein